METAQEALKIFIRSLPTGCRFSIIGFGSDSEMMSMNYGQTVIKYDENSMSFTLAKIDEMTSNLGATDILTPLIIA